MVWDRNKLEKTSEITIIPGSPAIPGSEGTAGSPAYSYYETTVVPGATYVDGPPTGYDNVVTLPLPGGGFQTISSGGYRYFDGVKAYLQTIILGVDYVYQAPDQTITQLVEVPAVPSVPAVPGVPATDAQISTDYNLGWNAGAYGPATLPVNSAFTWFFSTGNVGSVVGLTLSTAPQDYSYTGMALSVMAQSGKYQIYRGSTPVGSLKPFTTGSRFAFWRRNDGTVELYVNGGLVHTETLAADVVPDCSLYSGGDFIYDAEVVGFAELPLNSNISGSTQSDAQAVAAAINVTPTLGSNTALGVAGATTASAAVCGAVLVNGSLYTGSMGATTASDAQAVDNVVGVTPTLGPSTERGVAGATTASDAQIVGDAATGVGISTNGGTGDPAMLPLTAAASGPNVFVGWTGNYVGDAMNMLPMTAEASGDLAAPTIGLGLCYMAPLDAAATGLTGSTSTSASAEMLPLTMFGAEEADYSYGYGSMVPLTGGGTDEPYEDLVSSVIEILEEVVVTGTTRVDYVQEILERLQVASPTQTFSQLAVELLDAAQALDDTAVALIVTVAEGFNATDNLTVTQVLKVLDELAASDAVETVYTAAAIVLAAIGASDNEIYGGSAVGATAGVTVSDFGPPTVVFRFTGYWPAGTYIALQYTTDVGTYVADLTLTYAASGDGAMTLYTARLNEEPQLSAVYDGTDVTITAVAPATTVSI
jgi:hypothetical protein